MLLPVAIPKIQLPVRSRSGEKRIPIFSRRRVLVVIYKSDTQRAVWSVDTVEVDKKYATAASAAGLLETFKYSPCAVSKIQT